jgi:hypothetical protein
MDMTIEGIKELRAAVVRQACFDYCATLKNRDARFIGMERGVVENSTRKNPLSAGSAVRNSRSSAPWMGK